VNVVGLIEADFPGAGCGEMITPEPGQGRGRRWKNRNLIGISGWHMSKLMTSREGDEIKEVTLRIKEKLIYEFWACGF
jgi:hypothetical protein